MTSTAAGAAVLLGPGRLRAAEDGPERVDLRVRIREGERVIFQVTVPITLGRRAEMGGGKGSDAHRVGMMVYRSKKHAGAYMVLLEHTHGGKEIGEPAFLVAPLQPATMELGGRGSKLRRYDVEVLPRG